MCVLGWYTHEIDRQVGKDSTYLYSDGNALLTLFVGAIWTSRGKEGEPSFIFVLASSGSGSTRTTAMCAYCIILSIFWSKFFLPFLYLFV